MAFNFNPTILNSAVSNENFSITNSGRSTIPIKVITQPFERVERKGSVVYNPDNEKLYYSDGVKWLQIISSIHGNVLCISDADFDTQICTDTEPETNADTIFMRTAGTERVTINEVGAVIETLLSKDVTTVNNINNTSTGGNITNTTNTGTISDTTTSGDITNTSTSGDIINTTNNDGDITNTTNNGDVTNTTNTGDITNTSTSGDISNTTNNAGTITNTTTDGDITNTTTNNGDINNTTTNNGDINNTTNNDGDITNTTIDGDITNTSTNDGNISNTTNNAGNITNTTNDGDISNTTTTSGNITNTTNNTGDIINTTTTGDITNTTTTSGDITNTTNNDGNITNTTNNAGNITNTTNDTGSITNTTNNAGNITNTTNDTGSITNTTNSGDINNTSTSGDINNTTTTGSITESADSMTTTVVNNYELTSTSGDIIQTAEDGDWCTFTLDGFIKSSALSYFLDTAEKIVMKAVGVDSNDCILMQICTGNIIEEALDGDISSLAPQGAIIQEAEEFLSTASTGDICNTSLLGTIKQAAVSYLVDTSDDIDLCSTGGQICSRAPNSRIKNESMTSEYTTTGDTTITSGGSITAKSMAGGDINVTAMPGGDVISRAINGNINLCSDEGDINSTAGSNSDPVSGSINNNAGDNTGSGDGGDVNNNGGDGDSGNGGDSNNSGGDSNSGNGGNSNNTGGDSNSSGDGGNSNNTGGNSDSGSGGDSNNTGGDSNSSDGGNSNNSGGDSTDGNGGNSNNNGGNSDNGNGGNSNNTGGDSNSSGDGGNSNNTGGNSDSGNGGNSNNSGGDSNSGDGGDVNINGGNSGSGSGGNINITPGTSISGIPGGVTITAPITKIEGNLCVTGDTITINTETVNVEDNCIYLNNSYTTSGVGLGGCIVINYLPTSNVVMVDTGGFTAGVNAISNPTVMKTNAHTFSVGDIIQIAGASNTSNNGLFEVLSDTGTLLTIRGIGTAATTVDFVQTQFTVDATVAGEIRQVNVMTIGSSSTGEFVTQNGNNTSDTSIINPDPVVSSIVPGTGILVDDTDPSNPIVSTDGSSVQSVTGGTNIIVDNTDPVNPIINNDGVLSVTAGAGITVDNSDTNNPIVLANPLAKTRCTYHWCSDFHYDVDFNLDNPGRGPVLWTPPATLYEENNIVVESDGRVRMSGAAVSPTLVLISWFVNGDFADDQEIYGLMWVYKNGSPIAWSPRRFLSPYIFDTFAAPLGLLQTIYEVRERYTEGQASGSLVTTLANGDIIDLRGGLADAATGPVTNRELFNYSLTVVEL